MSDERLAEILNELQARGDTIRAARSCHSDDSIVLPKTGFIHLWLPRREAGRNTSDIEDPLAPRQILSVKYEVMVHERQKKNALFRSA